MIRKYIHYIAGFITAFLPVHLSVLSFVGFVLYELFEFIKKNDTLYLEMRDYVVGLYCGALLRLLF